ncbi:hypothetical protein AURDEDRAFT_177823 [Auricularia subglabra TFB-10046 SS5]|uniref:Uncharacterized protein n=1 Tax=Auricularia subglabra (strain TFB-10046 / SS5) TaxID=717982 RepID=J0WLA8_AURST|nr:hypothetical protein AURDEDRAFT_177823 [Auricularia subglabra TFB-10046 SS5]
MSTAVPPKGKFPDSPDQIPPLRANPALPVLSPDGLLEVFTHPSLTISAEIHNNEHFQKLGNIALQYAIGRLTWTRGPEHRDKALETLLSDENIAEWAKEYGLRERLRFRPEVAASIDKSAELAALFKAYVGAVDSELGPAVLTRWIEDLINAPPLTEAQPPPTAPPSGPPEKAGVFSALLNQMSQINKHKLDFVAESTGPAHNLTWTVHVSIDGVQEASGKGPSKAVAKENAARGVCRKKDWNP